MSFTTALMFAFCFWGVAALKEAAQTGSGRSAVIGLGFILVGVLIAVVPIRIG